MLRISVIVIHSHNSKFSFVNDADVLLNQRVTVSLALSTLSGLDVVVQTKRSTSASTALTASGGSQTRARPLPTQKTMSGEGLRHGTSRKMWPSRKEKPCSSISRRGAPRARQSVWFQRVSVLLNHKVPRPCQVDSNHPHIHPVQSTTYKLKLHRFAHWYEDADALAAFGALSSWCSTGVVFFFHTMNVFSALVDSQKQMQFLQLVEQLKPPEPFASFVHDVGGLFV